jgi:hypothetical protein
VELEDSHQLHLGELLEDHQHHQREGLEDLEEWIQCVAQLHHHHQWHHHLQHHLWVDKEEEVNSDYHN